MVAQQRLRITFAKGPELKYISHLDLALAWERALRRAGVPLAYSQGYHPQAKLQLASGLPVGYTGSAEMLDAILSDSLSPQAFLEQVAASLPRGLRLVAVEEMPLKCPSLQSALRQAEYRVSLPTLLPAEELARRLRDLLAADRLEQQRTRKGRTETFDLRPLLDDVWLQATTEDQTILGMRLSAGQLGNLRPDAILVALGLADSHAQVERTRLIFGSRPDEEDETGQGGPEGLGEMFRVG